jgi:hypothetical protein
MISFDDDIWKNNNCTDVSQGDQYFTYNKYLSGTNISVKIPFFWYAKIIFFLHKSLIYLHNKQHLQLIPQ